MIAYQNVFDHELNNYIIFNGIIFAAMGPWLNEFLSRQSLPALVKLRNQLVFIENPSFRNVNLKTCDYNCQRHKKHSRGACLGLEQAPDENHDRNKQCSLLGLQLATKMVQTRAKLKRLSAKFLIFFFFASILISSLWLGTLRMLFYPIPRRRDESSTWRTF